MIACECRGRLTATAPVPPAADLAVMLIDEYTKYPYGTGVMPFNYCAAKAMAPSWSHALFDAIC